MGIDAKAYEGQTVSLSFTRALSYSVDIDATELRRIVDKHCPENAGDTLNAALWTPWGNESVMDAIVMDILTAAGVTDHDDVEITDLNDDADAIDDTDDEETCAECSEPMDDHCEECGECECTCGDESDED